MNFIDLCSGIGGFRVGLEMSGHKCIGFSEIDKYALKSYRQMFDTESEWFSDDIRKLKSEDIPRCDLWSFGFPCQNVSIAGNRKGLDGEKSSLFYTIINLIKGKAPEDRPMWILCENVANILSIKQGSDFTNILCEMAEAGYDVEWQNINSKYFGVPQNRNRIYIIGHIRGKSRKKIFPISPKSKGTLKQVIAGSQGCRVYDPNGISCTITSQSGGMGAKTGLYLVNLGKKPKLTKVAECILAKYNNGITNRGESLGVLEIKDEATIRRLTPKECFRLQSFSDELFDKAQKVNSDTQLYKQVGNSVTVNVVYEIGLKLLEVEAMTEI